MLLFTAAVVSIIAVIALLIAAQFIHIVPAGRIHVLRRPGKPARLLRRRVSFVSPLDDSVVVEFPSAQLEELSDAHIFELVS